MKIVYFLKIIASQNFWAILRILFFMLFPLHRAHGTYFGITESREFKLGMLGGCILSFVKINLLITIVLMSVVMDRHRQLANRMPWELCSFKTINIKFVVVCLSLHRTM
jgi:hypothetical protein